MNREKTTQFVIKLIKLTRSGELDWVSNPVSNPLLANGEVIIDKIYKAVIDSNTLKLYRYTCKYFHDEDEFEWVHRIRLELIDKRGDTDYEFDYDNSMNDLYDIVREQTSNVSEIVDDLLGLKLEILEAVYYTPNRSLDVTDSIKNKVFKNRLVLEANNDIAEDPEYGVVKKLKVKYSYAGEILEKEVAENQTISIP